MVGVMQGYVRVTSAYRKKKVRGFSFRLCVFGLVIAIVYNPSIPLNNPYSDGSSTLI